MPAGAPGASSRGRGGKFKKYTRGGGKHFSRDLQPVDDEGNAVSMWSAEGQSKIRGEGSSASSSEESSEEEEDSDEEPAAGPSKDEANATREFRKAQKKARKEAAIAKAKGQNVEVGDMPSSDDSEDEDDDMPANPNHSKAARKQAAKPAVDEDVDEVTDGVAKMKAGNRKEREALEAAAAKERHMKLQAEGKTDDAKADLERLRLIRERREADAQRRQAEKEEREEQERAKKAEIEAREARKREAAAGPKKGKKK